MDEKLERQRIRYVFVLATIGIIASLITVTLSILLFRGDSNVTAEIPSMVGGLTTLIGTLVGAVAGQQVGAAGREAAQRRADTLQTEVDTFYEVSPTYPGMLEHVQRLVSQRRSSSAPPNP